MRPGRRDHVFGAHVMPQPQKDIERTSTGSCSRDDSFRLLVEGVKDYAIFMLDPGGRVVSWNAGATRIKGYREDEILGRHFSCFYSEEDIASGKPEQELATAAARGRHEEEGRRVRKDGSQFWAAVVITALQDEGGKLRGFAKLTRDITERKRAEKSRLMVELAVNAMIMVDRQGQIVLINPQTEKLFGYTRDELLGQPVEILVPERFRKDHPDYREAFFAAPTVRPMGAGRDLYGRRKDGSEFPVEIGLNPVETDEGRLVLSSIVDITERKRAEEKFRLAVESAPNAMVMIDQNGRMVLTNLQTERLFGYRRDELLGQPVEMLVPDRFRPRHPAYRRAFFNEPVARSMGTGRDLFGRHKDGSEFPVEIGLNPIHTEEGLFVLSAIVDITQRKQLEEKARGHLAELAHAGRLTTIGEMASGLAHEINQPLAAAANYARACVRFAHSGQGATMEELVGWMEKAAVQTTRACEIVNRLGAYVKKDISPPSLINLNEIVQHVIALVGPGMWRELHSPDVGAVTIELAPTLPRVLADRIQIEQVLVNLVRNAIEAMQESPAEKRRLVILTSHDCDLVRISVSDSGPGIGPEHLSLLFQPFFTTKPRGMGLGLSISRSIIEAHEGHLTVESRLGCGSTFSLTLPIARTETKS